VSRFYRRNREFPVRDLRAPETTMFQGEVSLSLPVAGEGDGVARQAPHFPRAIVPMENALVPTRSGARLRWVTVTPKGMHSRPCALGI
jgi:hypothetical protein